VGQASIKREVTGVGLAVDVTGCEGGLARERGGCPLVREGERSEIEREVRKRKSPKRESETGHK
jgi:hypothetical protein